MNKIISLLFLFSVTSFSYGKSCLAEKIESTFVPHEAKHFKIDYYKKFKIISIDKDQYLLADHLDQIGCEFPYKIKTPVKKVAMTSTTYLPTLILLDEVDSLRAFQNKDYIYSDSFHVKDIVNLPFELKIEQLINLKIDLVMAYQENIAAKDKAPLFYKFNIPLVLNLDLLETSPLARAEWMVYIASFYNKERQAMDFFGQILSSYIKKKENVKVKQKVLIGDIQNGKWVTPGTLSDLGKMISDAGGELAIKINSRETQYLPLEYLYKNKIQADIWITNNTWTKKQDYLKDSRYKVVNVKHIYNFNRKVNSKGSNDYWEMGLQRPDLILNDLINMFEGNGQHLVWYREL